MGLSLSAEVVGVQATSDPVWTRCFEDFILEPQWILAKLKLLVKVVQHHACEQTRCTSPDNTELDNIGVFTLGSLNGATALSLEGNCRKLRLNWFLWDGKRHFLMARCMAEILMDSTREGMVASPLVLERNI